MTYTTVDTTTSTDYDVIETNYYLFRDIDRECAVDVIRWINEANELELEEPITLYLNSDGGEIFQCFAIVDAIQLSKTPIRIVASGAIMSSAFLIFASGTKGLREITKNCSVMSHQYFIEMSGKYHEMQSATRRVELINEQMCQVLTDHSNLTASEVQELLLPPSDVVLTPNDLLKYGIADKVLLRYGQ